MSRAVHLLPPVLLLALMLLAHPFRDVFVFDPDEGNNLMKARLLADGHAMHSEIWSDQPALFTWALAGWCEATGWGVTQGRVLVLLCSAALLGLLYRAAWLTAGTTAAVAACGLLVLSFSYLRLSVSVMLGIPSLMLAMAAACCALEHRSRRHTAWLVASGALLALAVFVKMWVLLLAPVVLGAAGITPQWRRPVLAWSASFAATACLLLVLTVPLGEIGQLLRPHVDVRQAGSFGGNTRAFAGNFLTDAGLVALAAAGVVLAVRRRDWLLMVPAAWCVLAAAVLAGHAPLWYHHYLLVSIPMAWCGGYAIARLAARQWIAAAAVGIAIVAWRAPLVWRDDFAAWRHRDHLPERHLVKLMSGLADPGAVVVTDQQILPFRCGLRVPPQLAVTSLKRRWSGGLDDGTLIALIETYRPQQIALSGQRITLTPGLLAYLGPRYAQAYGDPWGWLLLVRGDLAGDMLPAVTAAAEAFPECWEAQLNLAEQLTRAGEPDRARAAFARALDLVPDDPGLEVVRDRLVAVAGAGG